MSDLELQRRKVHGVLSSKSLLESVERLTLNKPTIQKSKSNLNLKKPNEVINSARIFKFKFQFKARNLVYLL